MVEGRSREGCRVQRVRYRLDGRKRRSSDEQSDIARGHGECRRLGGVSPRPAQRAFLRPHGLQVLQERRRPVRRRDEEGGRAIPSATWASPAADVDGVVGDKTWSALPQGQPELAPTGTDGQTPGTFVDHGKHLRFHPEEMGYANGVNNSNDQIYFRVIIVGDEDVPKEDVKPFVPRTSRARTARPSRPSSTTTPGRPGRAAGSSAGGRTRPTTAPPAATGRSPSSRWSTAATPPKWSSTAKSPPDAASLTRARNGGGGGIRTHGRLPFTRFPSVPIRPLSHPSRVAPFWCRKGSRRVGFDPRCVPGSAACAARFLGSEVTVGSCATGAREPGQARDGAAFIGIAGVPQIAWPSPHSPRTDHEPIRWAAWTRWRPSLPRSSTWRTRSCGPRPRPSTVPASRARASCTRSGSGTANGCGAGSPRRRSSLKAKHLARMPMMSLTYWRPNHDTCTRPLPHGVGRHAGGAGGVVGALQRGARIRSAMCPRSSPPGPSPAAPAFGALELEPVAIRVMEGSTMVGRRRAAARMAGGLSAVSSLTRPGRRSRLRLAELMQ